jgi:hypothetical protein
MVMLLNKGEMMFTFSHRQSRPVTSELFDMAEQGLIDWESLARDALGWMSEDEVKEFAQRNDYLVEGEDDE